ncbi:MAG: hypothetical protein H0Z33_00280 [Bacillaceae bacterium]|nr:hypothetical protein [Bacillaceae bacterium]
MGKGFSLIIDLEQAQGFFPEKHERFQDLIRFCREHGMKKGACVIRDPKWKNRMQQKLEEQGNDCREAYFDSAHKAEAFLQEA